MAKFQVFVTNVVSTVVEVEADDAESAIQAAFDSNDMPGSITIDAFGQNSVDDSEWEARSVTDEDGKIVWSETE